MGADTTEMSSRRGSRGLRRMLAGLGEALLALLPALVVLVPTGAMIAVAVALAAGGTPRPECVNETHPMPVGPPAQEQPIATTSPDIATLARTYQPTVKMSLLDRFWPVSVTAVLAERSPTGAGTELVSGARTIESPTLADMRASDPASAYMAYPAVLGDKAAQMRDFLRGIGVPAPSIAAWPVNLSGAAERTGQIYFYDGGTHCTFAGRALTGYRALEYWFFYPFNYYPMTVDAAGMLARPLQTDGTDIDYHEGDWEHVTVLVAPNGTPAYVWMARHDTEGVLIPWDQVQTDGTHPIVYPALGGHPSYPDCGAHLRAKLAAAVDDYVVCGQGLYTFPGATTPLVDLGHVSWSCWRGHFGTTTGTTATSNADDPSGLILVAGPGTPLRQGENKDACAHIG
jgi:hypothetical protein